MPRIVAEPGLQVWYISGCEKPTGEVIANLIETLGVERLNNAKWVEVWFQCCQKNRLLRATGCPAMLAVPQSMEVV